MAKNFWENDEVVQSASSTDRFWENDEIVQQPTENFWEQDEVVTTPTPGPDTMFYGSEAAKVAGFGPGTEALPYLEAASRALAPEEKEQQDSLISRLVKGLWNSIIALPAYALKTETEIGKAQKELHSLAYLEKDFRRRAFSGEPVTEGEIQWYAAPTNKDGKSVKRPFWAETVWLNYQNKRLNVQEQSKEDALKQVEEAGKAGELKQSQIADISLQVSEAQGLKDKAVDVLAGLVGFGVRLAALKKAFPDLSPALIWELEAEASGETPGKGALTYALFTAPGKVIPQATKAGKVATVAAESALLGGATALESKLATGEVDLEQVALSMSIPAGARLSGFLGAGAKLRNPKVENAIVKASKRTQKGPAVSPEVQQVQATRVARKILPPVTEQKKLPFPQKRLPMSADEVVTLKAQQLYDEYLQKISSGDKRASTKLSTLVQGLNLPSLQDLHERLYMGDKSAVDEIRAGRYAFSPESYVLGLKAEAASRLKIPADEVSDMRPVLRGKRAEIVPQPVPYGTQPGYRPPPPEPPRPSMYEVTRLSERKVGLVKKIKTPQKVEAPKEPASRDEPTFEAASANLTSWSEKVMPTARTEREAAVKQRRGEQAGKYQAGLEEGGERKLPFWERWRVAKGKMKGKAKGADLETVPPLSDAQWETLAQKATEVYGKKSFSHNEAMESLDKLRKGNLPEPHEWGTLEKVLGTETTVKLYDNLTKNTPAYRGLGWIKMFRDLLKLRFGFDPQAPRQFSWLKKRHPFFFAHIKVMNLRAMAFGKYLKQLTKEVESDPLFVEAKDQGVNFIGTKPWEVGKKTTGKKGARLEQYGQITDFLSNHKNRVVRTYGQLVRRIEEASNATVNWGLKRQYEIAKKTVARLAEREGWGQKETDKFLKERIDDINLFSRRSVTKSQVGRELRSAGNWLFFSTEYTTSRPRSTWRAFRNLVKGSPGNRTYAMQLALSKIGWMMAEGAIITALAAKSALNTPGKAHRVDGSADSSDELFGKIRVDNDVFDLSEGDASWWRLLARLGVSAWAYAESKATNKPVTEIAGSKVRSPGEELKRYITSRETLLLGLIQTLATGKDWMGKPIPLQKVIFDQIPFEPLQAIINAGAADGLWEELYNGQTLEAGKSLASNIPISALSLLGYASQSYPEAAYKVRNDFRDVVAEADHSKSWKELTPREQTKLERKYKDKFSELDKKIKQEDVDNPIDLEAIQKEEKVSGDRIKKRLSKETLGKLGDVSLLTTRRPGEFYLNDTRFARYEELIAENVTKNLARFPSPKESLVEMLVERSKDKAWIQLQKEMK